MICAMYILGDAQSGLYLVGIGEEVGSLACTQRVTLSDTCPQWGMGEKRICAMNIVGDAH